MQSVRLTLMTMAMAMEWRIKLGQEGTVKVIQKVAVESEWAQPRFCEGCAPASGGESRVMTVA